MKLPFFPLLFTGLFLLSGAGFGQETASSLTKPPVKPDRFLHRITVGGNLGFQFGNVTGITIAPEAAIRTIDQLHVGIRPIYQYYNYKNYYLNLNTGDFLNHRMSVYGGGVFLRYYLRSLFDSFLGNLFAHAEYEYLYYIRPYRFNPQGYIQDPYLNYYVPGKEAVEINSLFVGGGYSQPLAGRVTLDLLILFNLNDSFQSPYSNPVFRMGVGVGL